jgi:6-phosphogluconolactonase
MTSKKPVSYYAYVGSRTTRERNARGDGINVYRVNGETGAWGHVQLVPGLLNPSFLAFDRDQRFLYAVHGDASEISAFSISPRTGELAFINRVTTSGRNPVHLSVDLSNRFIVVANHITSSLVVLPRHDDGSVGEPVDLVEVKGEIGPHRIEQPFAKPHQVEFDCTGQFVIVPDKGLDQVFTYRFDKEAGRLLPAGGAPAREGAGPRHVALHPSNGIAYVLNELDSTVTGYHFDPVTGILQPLQVISALPDTFIGHSRAAEITVSSDGRFVYASNRGHDSIAVFAVDQPSGRLRNVDWVGCRGRIPRFFSLNPTGLDLVVANEDSDSIVSFCVNQQTGMLEAPREVAQTGSPVCVIFTDNQ